MGVVNLCMYVGCVLNAWNVGGSELRESLKEGVPVRITKATANSRYGGFHNVHCKRRNNFLKMCYRISGFFEGIIFPESCSNSYS